MPDEHSNGDFIAEYREPEPTLEELADEYVKTLYTPANGWGQHVHPRYGQSHNIMKLMWPRFGREASNKAIDAAFAKRRSQRALSL